MSAMPKVGRNRHGIGSPYAQSGKRIDGFRLNWPVYSLIDALL